MRWQIVDKFPSMCSAKLWYPHICDDLVAYFSMPCDSCRKTDGKTRVCACLTVAYVVPTDSASTT